MKKLNVEIGDKFGDYTVISEPFIDCGKEKIKCQCKCGHIRIPYKCNIKRLVCCRFCNAVEKYRKYKPGDRHESLTVIRYLNKDEHLLKNNRTRLLVKCDCGNIFSILSNWFYKGKSCSCSRKKKGIDHPSYKGLKYVSRTYFSQIKNNAKKRNLDFSIDIEYIDDLMSIQETKCALTGLPIEIGNTKSASTASLDRIQNNFGYVEGNVQWLHKDINRMKSDFSSEYFKSLCMAVCKNL